MGTAEPPNKGHVGDNIDSAVVSFVERLTSFEGLKCIRTIGETIFGTLTCVLCREVYYIVSLTEVLLYTNNMSYQWQHRGDIQMKCSGNYCSRIN